MAYDNAFERGNHGTAFHDFGKLERALAQRDALAKALEQIKEAAHKDSLTPAERLQDIRIMLSRVGGARE